LECGNIKIKSYPEFSVFFQIYLSKEYELIQNPCFQELFLEAEKIMLNICKWGSFLC